MLDGPWKVSDDVGKVLGGLGKVLDGLGMVLAVPIKHVSFLVPPFF